MNNKINEEEKPKKNLENSICWATCFLIIFLLEMRLFGRLNWNQQGGSKDVCRFQSMEYPSNKHLIKHDIEMSFSWFLYLRTNYVVNICRLCFQPKSLDLDVRVRVSSDRPVIKMARRNNATNSFFITRMTKTMEFFIGKTNCMMRLRRTHG